MRKRMIALALCGLMVFAGNTQVFAANISTDEPIVVLPQMENIRQSLTELFIDAYGNATINSYVYGKSGTTTRVKISAKLQKYVNGSWDKWRNFTY